jgi:hypothetical protein
MFAPAYMGRKWFLRMLLLYVQERLPFSKSAITLYRNQVPQSLP